MNRTKFQRGTDAIGTAIVIALVICGITLITSGRSSSCRAEETKRPAAALPAKLTELDLTKLKLATTSMQLAQERAKAAVAQANAEISAGEKQVQEICDAYKIDRAQLAQSVDEKTGAITRLSDPKKAAKK